MLWHSSRESIIFGAIALVVIAIDKRKAIASFYAVWDEDEEVGVGDVWSMNAFLTALLLVAGIGIDIFFATIFFFANTIYHIPANGEQIAAVASRPWLPTQKITVEPGKTFVGYTLSTSDGWYIFLQQRDRTVNYFHAGSVSNRTLCQLNGIARPNRPPLIKLINAPVPIVPRCFPSSTQEGSPPILPPSSP